MNKFRGFLLVAAVGWFVLPVPLGNAQGTDSQEVYLEELPQEPPASIVRHRKAQGKYENGQLKMEREEALLSDDTVVSDGTYIEYYPDGQKFCEGRYEQGVITGEWKYWHPNGQLCKSILFQSGKPNGRIEVFRDDGSLESVQTFANGIRSGEWSSFYEDGKTPKVKATLVDGKIDGERTTYYPDGTIRQQTNFAKGVLEGLVVEYDETGKKIAEATFENGQRKSVQRFDQESP